MDRELITFLFIKFQLIFAWIIFFFFFGTEKPFPFINKLLFAQFIYTKFKEIMKLLNDVYKNCELDDCFLIDKI